MNPTIKLGLVLAIALEISFTQVWTVNVVIAVISLFILFFSRWSLKRIGLLLLITTFFAAALSWSLAIQGHAAPHFILVIFTRMFAYALVGSTFTASTTIHDLSLALEQNLGLASQFAYGVLAAFNLMPKIQHEVQTIKAAALMRGQRLHFWSPQLYFKAILAAINWSENLAEAMTSHGFVEQRPRTHFQHYPIRSLDWTVLIVCLGLLQAGLFNGKLP